MASIGIHVYVYEHFFQKKKKKKGNILCVTWILTLATCFLKLFYIWRVLEIFNSITLKKLLLYSLGFEIFDNFYGILHLTTKSYAR